MTSDEFKKLAKQKFAVIREHAREKNTYVPREMECIDIEVVNPYMAGKSREYFNLNEEVLEKAEREGKMLRFSWDHGNSVFSPAQWRDGGQMSLHEFKYAGRLMRLVGNYLVRD